MTYRCDECGSIATGKPIFRNNGDRVCIACSHKGNKEAFSDFMHNEHMTRVMWRTLSVK